jgi:hypothetical protein
VRLSLCVCVVCVLYIYIFMCVCLMYVVVCVLSVLRTPPVRPTTLNPTTNQITQPLPPPPIFGLKKTNNIQTKHQSLLEKWEGEERKPVDKATYPMWAELLMKDDARLARYSGGGGGGVGAGAGEEEEEEEEEEE